jgi:hypothetical protein
VPLKRWLKNALDHVIHVCMNEPGLEFVWVGDDAVDPLEQAQTLQILIGAGIKTREEARADLGLGPTGGKAPAGPPVAKRGATRPLLGKLNPHHDERGQFATADGAVATVGSPARKPRPTRVQVASNDATVRPDVSPDTVSPKAQGESEAGELVAQAPPALGTSKYSVNLRAEEQLWGGHAVRDHVGKTNAELIAQVESTRVDSPARDGLVESKYTPEGSYLSSEAANDFINRLLQSHTDLVDPVASGEWDQAWIEDRIGSHTGIEAFLDAQGQVTTRDTYNAGVLIVHDDRVPRGYRVKTAYPRNDRNSYPSLTPPR